MSKKSVPEHFRFCPSCGSEKLALRGGKCVECPDCSFTLYFNPTCSAGALIFDQQGKLLVVERANEPSKGKYGIPGGFTDPGERLEEVAVRETKEETNLDIHSVKFFASFPNVYTYREVSYAVTDTYFLAKVDSFEGLEAEEGEVAGLHRVDPKEVPQDQWAFDSLRNAIAKYLAEY
ncbi:NUDIX domain-containing protein [Pelagicoccus sp. SDUM812002]|uniref:NUDIX hydrolase n=1 Tax=Pelagicoccus sp. SDUM812002 TaxID=3041266 RepID=UPI0028109F4C|nr:NUDIX domain-containing protein [Pelagicoccus sp. SDUM812002]